MDCVRLYLEWYELRQSWEGSNMNPEQDFVMKTIKSRDVHFVRLWFTDVLGTMKSFAVSAGSGTPGF